MDRSQIVVGGIYEFDYDKSHAALVADGLSMNYKQDLSAYKAVLIKGQHDSGEYYGDEYPLSNISLYIGQIHLAGLTKQIGYDATYSAEYKQAQAELERVKGLRDGFDAIVSDPSFGILITPFSINAVSKEFVRQIEVLSDKLERIKAQSKGMEYDPLG